MVVCWVWMLVVEELFCESVSLCVVEEMDSGGCGDLCVVVFVMWLFGVDLFVW